MARPSPKDLLLTALFGRWRRSPALEPGYTVLLPSPMDMPFLLRFALEGLRHLDLDDCRQVIVIPDGSGNDRGEALRAVVAESDDPRVEFATMPPLAHAFVHRMGRTGGGVANWTHWAMIVEGTNRARCEHIFLHDADAFFIDADGPERQYRACRDRGLATLGVTPRLDPFFAEHGVTIPGTWELMYSTRWARSYRPIDLKGRWRDTPKGPNEFDTMLYPQFLDAFDGRVGVLEPPPRILHFAGSITTYRTYRDARSGSVGDVLFRLLLLSMLEELLPPPVGPRALPSAADLARGLDDPTAPVTYGSEVATREYPIFRGMIEDLCGAPIMIGERADRIREMIRPFDRHFESREAAPALHAAPRRDGLG